MSGGPDKRREALRLGRRAAMMLPVSALAGCGLFDDLFSDNKTPLPGTREAIMAPERGLEVDKNAGPPPSVVLPGAVANANWPQPGGNPSHLMGHLAAPARLTEAWRVSIGEGGGYRKKILAHPMVAGTTIFAMDSSGVVTAHDTASGSRRWRFDTVSPDIDSTNVGGGLCWDSGTLYAVNGVADLVALNAATGEQRWRTRLDTPARSAPTFAEGRLYIVTIDDKVVARAADDGRSLWSHQANSGLANLLGQPSPAFADGLLVAAAGSGELACLRAGTGNVAWTDNLGAARGRTSLADLSAIRGLPVIAEGTVYTIGLGGLMVALDLRSGRRLWERDVAGQDTPWVAGDWVFVLSIEQRLAAVNRLDGRVAWVTDLPRYDNPEKLEDPIFWFGPVLAGDRLIVAGTNSEALSVSPYSGEVLGRQKLSSAASLSPIVAAGTVYFVTDDGALLALR